jgi:hypothetical protein
MTSKSSSSSTASIEIHCRHRTASGRRCRQPISDPHSGLCFTHAARRQKDGDLADLSSSLTGHSEEFQTATGINRSLADLYVLLAQNRISPRRAAVLAYISNLLLRSLSAIDREENLQTGEDTGPTIVWDLPRPNRDPVDRSAVAQDEDRFTAAPTTECPS